MTIEDVAKVCHEVNRVYCASLGDHSQVPWEQAPEWQCLSAIAGVNHRLANPGAPASASHESWLAHKRDEGWVYGPVKDAERRTHPCMVPYDDLPLEQRTKDALFVAVVEAYRTCVSRKTPKIEAIRVVYMGDLIPERWNADRNGAFECVPYTWGDCAYSLITRAQFISMIRDGMDGLVGDSELTEWESWVISNVPPDVLVDLEGTYADA